MSVVPSNNSLRRYVKDRRARRIQECNERIEQSETDIRELEAAIKDVTNIIAKIDKEINESSAFVSNLKGNVHVRKIARDIKDIQAEIDAFDMEEAAKARRTFAEKFPGEKDKENKMHSKVCILRRVMIGLRS
jgi:DNA repair protein RAD50